MARIPGLYRRGCVWLNAAAVAALILLGAPSPSPWAAINLDTAMVEKTVVFIYPANDDGKVIDDRPAATGFWVEVPLKSDPSRPALVLVTARHVVDPIWTRCSDKNPSRIFLRVNLKKSKADGSRVAFVPVDLTRDSSPTYFTAGDSDDVAVLPISAPAMRFEDYEAAALPLRFFATPSEAKNLTISDSVVSAGLLPAFPGLGRNYPIFKFGSISNLPDEAAPVPCPPKPGADPRQPAVTKAKKVWLLAMNLVPGNSGSPIFYAPSGASGGAGGTTFHVQVGFGRPMLIGLQSIANWHADVAGMTPIEPIFEAIAKIGLPDADLSRGPSPRRR